MLFQASGLAVFLRDMRIGQFYRHFGNFAVSTTSVNTARTKVQICVDFRARPSSIGNEGDKI